MTCDRFRDELADAAAGAAASQALEAHLAGCEPCRARLGQARALLGRVDAELASALRIAPSPALVPQVRRRLAEPEAAWSGGPWRWLVPAAVGLATLVLGFYLGRGTGGAPQRETRTAQAPEGAGPPEPAPAIPPTAPAAAEPAASVRPPAAAAPSPARVARAAAAGPARTREPEVLVPKGEAEAFLTFVRSVSLRPWDPRSLLAAGLEPEPVPLPDIRMGAVEIAPLAVEPLPQDDRPLPRSDS